VTTVDVAPGLLRRVLDDLDRDGFSVVEAIITADEAAEIRDELRRIVADIPTGRNDFEGYATKRIYAIFAKTRMLDRLATHPLLLSVVDTLLGPSAQLSAPTGIDIAPGEKAQILHTDDSIYPVPRPHADIVVNSMWAFEDFTADNGATRVVPGSHQWTDRLPTEDETRTVTMPAGSVLFIRGTLWHGGGANRTDSPRLGVLLEYAAGWVRQQENHILAVPPEIVRSLDPRLQELLGYGVYPPFVGYVDGRHPRRSLD